MSISVDIRKKLGGFDLKVAFSADNEIVALLGASGCGKSVTLRCIAGMITPDEGEISLDGRVLFSSLKKINLPPQKRKVGLLFQHYALFPNMTVRGNISCVLKQNGSKDLDGDLEMLLKRCCIYGLEDHYPSQLSGGQQQRTALARILASRPAAVMLDEPLSALDSYMKWKLEQSLAKTLRDFGGTIIYVSHNRDEVYRLCDKVCAISGGHSETVRDAKDFFENPETLAAAILSGCKNYASIKKLSKCRIFAKEWNTELDCPPIEDSITYIGVRAHTIKFSKRPEKNSVQCRVLDVTEDLFSTVVTVIPINVARGSEFSQIRVELAKEETADIKVGKEVFITIPPDMIIPLKRCDESFVSL